MTTRLDREQKDLMVVSHTHTHTHRRQQTEGRVERVYFLELYTLEQTFCQSLEKQT